MTIETSIPSWLTREIDAKMFEALQEIERQESEAKQRLCELIRKRGAFFPPHPGPLRPSLQRTPKEPWANCQLIAIGEDYDWADEEWWYCEGFAYLGYLGRYEHHAWLVDRHGVVSDPTFPSTDDPELLSYIGVAVYHDYVECKVIGNPIEDDCSVWTPIEWLNVLDVKVLDDDWTVDEVVRPASEFGRANPLWRSSTHVPEYSHW